MLLGIDSFTQHLVNAIHCVADLRDLDANTRVSLRSFLDQAPTASPFQDPEFCGRSLLGGGIRCFHYVSATNGIDCDFYAFCTENYAASRYLPFLRGLFVHKGPVARDRAAFEMGAEQLRLWSQKQRYVSLAINPLYSEEDSQWLCRYASERGWSFAKSDTLATLLLPLSLSKDELLANLEKQTRYEIRRAARDNVTVHRGATGQDFLDFSEIHYRRSKKKSFGALDQQVFINLSQRILESPERGALFLSRVSGKTAGGVVVLRAGERVHYIYGAIDGELAGRRPVLYPALWEAIGWAKQIGAKEFDFGGYSLSGDPAVRRFKRGFGGVEVRFATGLECKLTPACRWKPILQR